MASSNGPGIGASPTAASPRSQRGRPPSRASSRTAASVRRTKVTLGRSAKKRLALLDVTGRTDHAVERERLLELGIALGSAASSDQLFGRAEARLCFERQCPHTGVDAGGPAEVSLGHGQGGVLPRGCGRLCHELAHLLPKSELPCDLHEHWAQHGGVLDVLPCEPKAFRGQRL